MPMAVKSMNIFPRMYRWLCKREENRKLIFCINSGRSGSHYLVTLLNTAKEIRAFHEPEPAMNGQYLQLINQYEYKDTYGRRKIKCNAIRKTLREMEENKIYCETNHMFIKTFFDVVIDAFKNVGIIILRRELVHVLKSFIELNYFTNKNEAWKDWMSSPNAKTHAIDCIDKDENLDQYDLCIAYLIDIEARIQRFLGKYPHLPIYEVRLEQLNDIESVKKLFAELDITMTHETYKVIGEKVNTREKRKKEFDNHTSLEYCRERIIEYIEKADLRGIKIPKSIAFDRLF